MCKSSCLRRRRGRIVRIKRRRNLHHGARRRPRRPRNQHYDYVLLSCSPASKRSFVSCSPASFQAFFSVLYPAPECILYTPMQSRRKAARAPQCLNQNWQIRRHNHINHDDAGQLRVSRAASRPEMRDTPSRGRWVDARPRSKVSSAARRRRRQCRSSVRVRRISVLLSLPRYRRSSQCGGRKTRLDKSANRQTNKTEGQTNTLSKSVGTRRAAPRRRSARSRRACGIDKAPESRLTSATVA